MKKSFTHLHVHSEYSLLDCSAKIPEIIKRIKELGMDSVAITDHGVMYGVIEFYKEAKKNNIHPILGCEVYVSSHSRFDKQGSGEQRYFHLVLLAENNEGYKNLIKLVSLGFTEGFYYKPRVDLELLKTYHKGIIALSACMSGPVSKTFLQGTYEDAKNVALLYENIFGKDNFFLELQNHFLPDDARLNNALIQIGKELAIPLVCTNDTHYIYREDSRAHDILLCVQTQKTVQDVNRMRYDGEEYYIKSAEEMYLLFPDQTEALQNTQKIAKRCQVEINFHELKLPKFDTPKPFTSNEFLEDLCLKGLEERYKENATMYRERLNFELETIRSMEFTDYFLIVWDFIKFAKDQGIIVGPGRGSAAGSLVSYCLHITDIDPMRHQLLFERFLNPERITMPDIDIDFCYERRQEVINYVIEKYGATHVAQIITFGTLAARAAVKDVGRALAMPYAEVDKISKMIPFELGITLKRALELNPELLYRYENEAEIKFLLDMSMKLEGLPRHASTHAAGVLICQEEVTEHVPLNLNDGAVTTQFPMQTLEELGLLKMDFLSLRTLTVIDKAVKEIERNCHITLCMSEIDYEDKRVYDLIGQAQTEGVFQLESRGMKSFLKELKPENFEDIIAGISLFRPGPMDFIPKYIRGKRNKNQITYTHEKLVPILKNTYGCIVYQEQVMEIARQLGGYTLGRSDLVRRVMSKKETEKMAEERKIFIEGNDEIKGCIKNGIPRKIAERIFDEMSDFAKYAFNKSHAAAYAVLAYQTAWLKVNYNVFFMAALMTSVMDNATKIAEYINECKNLNISLLPPDINESFSHFSVANQKIRFGLAAVKHVGKAAIELICSEREKHGNYASLSEFIERLGAQQLNKRMIESLIKAGAFDSLGGSRAQYMAIYKAILDGNSESTKKNLEGQVNLFDAFQINVLTDELPDVKDFSKTERLKLEKEILGVYISGHPMDPYKEKLQTLPYNTLDFYIGEDESGSVEKNLVYDGKKASIAGVIHDITKRYTKNGRIMSFLTIEDLYGFMEIIVFPDAYDAFAHLIEKDRVILCSGRLTVDASDGTVKLKAEELYDFEEFDFSKPLKKSLGIQISDSHMDIHTILGILTKHKGNTNVFIKKYNGEILKVSKEYHVSLSKELIHELSSLLGNDHIFIKEKTI